VTLKATEAGTTRVVFKGVVPDAGKVVSMPMRYKTTFTATASPTATTLAETRSLARVTRLALATRATGGTTSGGRRIYAATADPRFVTTVSPDRDGCLRYALQRRFADGWRTVSTSTCRWIVDRRARFILTGRQARGVGYRVRPTFAGDGKNGRTVGGWVYFRFR
jgi:hypothetical protein